MIGRLNRGGVMIGSLNRDGSALMPLLHIHTISHKRVAARSPTPLVCCSQGGADATHTKP